MNNKDFINRLSQRMGYSVSKTQGMMDNVVDFMGDGFQEGEPLSVAGFGTFEIKKKMERIMINPTTMQRMLVPPKLVLNFKPNIAWKERVKKGGDD